MIIDELRLIIRIARGLQFKLQKRELDEETDEIIRLLELIRNLDLKQQYSLDRKELSPDLIKRCKLIYALGTRALHEVQEKNYIPANIVGILERIISLEEEISTTLILPTKNLRQLLRYSPTEAIAHGVIFRGVSQTDYEKVMKGEYLFAPNPHGPITITEHILDPIKARDSPFISLTTDIKTAERFGKVLVIDINLLRGHLFTPAEIEADLKRRAGKIKWTNPLRLQRKNSEFLLGPSGTVVASISPESIINARRLVA